MNDTPLARAFAEDERMLWGLCYRMTGSAADADDLVQETFRRALESPPPDTGRPWRPWLVRVAVNASRDALRLRKRREYPGPWLPSPIPTGGEASPPSFEVPGRDGTEGRYDLIESVSFAFLLALEALTPQQRAVLLLRDVLDYSVEETAEALDLSAGAVKTTHHRARKAMEAYDRSRHPPTSRRQARTRETLERFLAALLAHDAATVESMLAADVRDLADGGGEFLAAKVPIRGREKVAKVLLHLARNAGRPTRMEVVMVNGLPALYVERVPAGPRDAPRYLFRIDVDEAGGIVEVHTVLARGKLTALAG